MEDILHSFYNVDFLQPRTAVKAFRNKFVQQGEVEKMTPSRNRGVALRQETQLSHPSGSSKISHPTFSPEKSCFVVTAKHIQSGDAV